MTVHATGDYLVTASLDRTWAFYDLQAQLCLAQVGLGHASLTKAWLTHCLLCCWGRLRFQLGSRLHPECVVCDLAGLMQLNC